MQKADDPLDINGDQERGSNMHSYPRENNWKVMAAKGDTTSDAMTTGNENSENKYPNNQRRVFVGQRSNKKTRSKTEARFKGLDIYALVEIVIES